jgi:hypothetical protein
MLIFFSEAQSATQDGRATGAGSIFIFFFSESQSFSQNGRATGAPSNFRTVKIIFFI